MARCPSCGRWISEREECRCGGLERQSDSVKGDYGRADSLSEDLTGCDDLQAIARFRNAAEAGYFLDELTRRLEITAEIVPQERFDAMHASWSTDFVLMVPREAAFPAAQCLRELAEQTASDDEDELQQAAPSADSRFGMGGGLWVPLALTFAAGAISCWGIERIERPRRPPALFVDRPSGLRLLEEMGALPESWEQPIPQTGGKRRLTIERALHTALLEEDRDGDGQFEFRRSFSWRQ